MSKLARICSVFDTTAVAELQVSCMGNLERPEHLNKDLSILRDSLLSLQAPTVMHGSILQDVKEIFAYIFQSCRNEYIVYSLCINPDYAMLRPGQLFALFFFF